MVSRRQLLKGLALAPAAYALRTPAVARGHAALTAGKGGFRFQVRRHETCLNNARWHPLSEGARAKVEQYQAYKARGDLQPADFYDVLQTGAKRDFARLINADPGDLAYVNSTTAGETMLVSSLGLPDGKGNIVTDALHFEGSLYMYGALRKQGMDVRCVRPDRHWRIRLEDMARVIDKHTRLVAVSWTSFINGFTHDMKALCDLAHAHGALVYVDAVQAVGAIPVDVRAADVDALGSASYKWLMGDFGMGFLYVNPRVIPRLRRIVWGYRQLDHFRYHAFPGDKPGPWPASWTQHDDASGFFEIGTYANIVLAALSYSLPAILELGVDAIQRHAQPLVARLQDELPRMGYAPMTPRDSGAPIATFLVRDVDQVRRKLHAAKVDVSLEDDGRMRISPSIYNTRDDIEKLLQTLA